MAVVNGSLLLPIICTCMPVMAMPVGGALKVERKFTGQTAKRLLFSGAGHPGGRLAGNCPLASFLRLPSEA